MDREQIIKEVTQIVAKVLKQEPLVLRDELTAGEIKGWDSLSHMLIISEVEKHFNIKFSFVDILNFKNMGDLFNCLESRLA